MCLHSTGDPVGRKIWDDWSKQSDKYNATNQERTWRGFKPNGGLNIESIYHLSLEAGWQPPLDASVDLQGLVAGLRGEVEDVDTSLYDPSPFPAHLYRVPGVLGDFAAWVGDTAPKRQPVFALASALSLGSAVCSRRYTTGTGMGLNTYAVILGDIGCGKSRPLAAVDQALTESGLGAMIMGEPVSDAGLVGAMYDAPESTAWVSFDEVGQFFQSTKRKFADYKSALPAAMLSLYEASSGVWRPRRYADMKGRATTPLIAPCLSWIGASVLSSFVESLVAGGELADAGLLSRLLVFQTRDNPPKQKFDGAGKTPASVVEWIERLRARKPAVGNMETIAGHGIKVRMTDEGEAALVEAEAKWCAVGEEYGAYHEIYARTPALVEKVATIVALSADPMTSVCDAECVGWAVDLVDHLVDEFKKTCNRQMAQASGDAERILRHITEASKRNGGMGLSRSNLARMNQKMPRRDREEVLMSLAEAGYIDKRNCGKITYFTIKK